MKVRLWWLGWTGLIFLGFIFPHPVLALQAQQASPLKLAPDLTADLELKPEKEQPSSTNIDSAAEQRTLIISEDPDRYQRQSQTAGKPDQPPTSSTGKVTEESNQDVSTDSANESGTYESDYVDASRIEVQAPEKKVKPAFPNQYVGLWALALIVLAIGRRGLRYLQFFQQEEYNGGRFLRWWWANAAMDKRQSLVLAIAFLCFQFGLILPGSHVGFIANFTLPALGMLLVAFMENDPRKHGKIKLNLTARASRIMWTSRSLLLVACGLIYAVWLLIFDAGASALWLLALMVVQVSPFTLPLAVWLLAPQEKRTQQKYLNEAKAKLAEVNPHVIGITGSYGKTSTKVILADLMEAVGPTFFPPKSINTVMGIVRQIREKMEPQHQYAIIEMGAYKKGSIARLCDLTPPTTGIVTAVGIMHLERFGSKEAVFEAKRELPEAVLAGKEPLVLCNADDPGSRRMGEWVQSQENGRLFFYGLDTGEQHVTLNCQGTDIALCSLDDNAPDDPLNWGTKLKLHWTPPVQPAQRVQPTSDGPPTSETPETPETQVFEVAVPLLGRAMLSNYLAAFSCAALMGGHPKALVAQSRLVKHAEHRLQLKRVRDGRHGGYVLLDDAYNANPSGFIAAIDVLAKLPARRRWLVTPGMIELGDQQFEENKRIAAYAMKPVDGKPIIDEVIIVGDTNRAAFAQSMSALGEHLHLVDHREKAHEYLFEHARPDDIVLWANDLPDLYEARPKF